MLLVGDDPAVIEPLRDDLRRSGFAIETSHDGEAGLRAALSGQHDLAVLDLATQGRAGLDALGRLRASSTLPVILLTAHDDTTERIVGLELGADDCVPEPWVPREIAARIRAVLRRTHAAPRPPLRRIVAGELTVWPAQRRATRAGEPIELTSTELNLLEALARNAGRPVSKATLSQEALGRPLSRFDRSIDVHVSKLRQKLGPLPDGRSRIQAVIHKGYQLLGD